MSIFKKLFWLAIFIAIAFFFMFRLDFSFGQDPEWGVTFSPGYAKDLKLDWQEAYIAMLDDLGVDNLRISAYWDQIEPERDEYDWLDIDWQIDQASQRGVNLVLAIGRRLPRWPECHDPEWISSLSETEVKAEILEMLELAVDRYKDNSNIVSWQVENEPLFAFFGECPKPNKDFLVEEVSLVKNLDPGRKIIITDSGELSTWQGAAGVADILGTTLYRIVWNEYLGFFEYWFAPPSIYTFKADITKALHKNLEKVIVMELQMEPWVLDKPMIEMTLEEQQKSFSLNQFRKNIEYTKRTGFDQAYLWGVEYWYFLKENGYPEIWDEAKGLWQK